MSAATAPRQISARMVLGALAVVVLVARTVVLRGLGLDPDRDRLSFRWWQYREEGTCPGQVAIGSPERAGTAVVRG